MDSDSSTVSRRDFLAASGTTLAAWPAAAEGLTRRYPIIDCQSHLFVPELLAIMERRKRPPLIETRDGQRFLVVGDWHRPMVSGLDLAAKLAAKDAAGIQR